MPAYLDISYTAPCHNRKNQKCFIDPTTVEVLFLTEVVDNPSHTLTKCMLILDFPLNFSADNHFSVPVLGDLPAAFSSTGSVFPGADVTEALLVEHALHSDAEETALLAFPRGSDAFLAKLLREAVSYLLYENNEVFSSYTSRMIRSVQWPNVIGGVWESGRLREDKIRSLESSSVHSVADCLSRIEEAVSFLSHSVDITESMKLPMRITSKLFSLMSVLLAVRLECESLQPLHDYLLHSPQMVSIEKWCDKLNEGCKVWPHRVISWRKNLRNSQDPSVQFIAPKPAGLWEWLGFTSQVSREEDSKFVADKGHNILFAMTAVGVVFIFLASSPSS